MRPSRPRGASVPGTFLGAAGGGGRSARAERLANGAAASDAMPANKPIRDRLLIISCYLLELAFFAERTRV